MPPVSPVPARNLPKLSGCRLVAAHQHLVRAIIAQIHRAVCIHRLHLHGIKQLDPRHRYARLQRLDHRAHGTAEILELDDGSADRLGDPEQFPMDVGFVCLLFLVAFTGLALLVLRDTSAMRASLIIHLATVMAFFLLMPYSKFVHGLYRGLAILKHQREQKSPNPLGLAEG